MNWNDKIQVKKGDIGQEIVREILEEGGLIVYEPKTNGAHWFDFVATRNKKEIFFIDVKTKARFNNWEAQGIDVKHYEDYMRLINQFNLPFFLFFVDDKNGDVHVANLKELKKPIQQPNENIIAWSIHEMLRVRQLDSETIKQLSALDSRNYKYNPK
jgi:hypothetical protein|tara:strand:+ start:582 stop:1052 length:471 start_codon:yes stop_codon:yes gene_type:complete